MRKLALLGLVGLLLVLAAGCDRTRPLDVSGTWTGTLTQTHTTGGVPIQTYWLFYRLDLLQSGTDISGTARIWRTYTGDQYAVMSVSGSVRGGVVNISEQEIIESGGGGGGWAVKSMVLRSVEGTLRGPWEDPSGLAGNVEVIRASR